MKFTIVSAVLAISVLVGCSHKQDAARIPASADKDQKVPCGLEGSINDRIADCSYQESVVKKGFVLVTRSKNLKEVYKEIGTGLLWSDVFPKKIFYAALNECQDGRVEMGGISGNWRLPMKQSYVTANGHGITKALKMKHTYWTGTQDMSDLPARVWAFSSRTGKFESVASNPDELFFHCIANAEE